MMYEYDYINGKRRVNEILNDSNEIEEKEKIPKMNEFTFHNGYFAWVTAVFVDIRDSTSIFTENKKTSTSKIIRAFTSEVIEILKNDDNLREIGIRGDCVYAIYTTSKKHEDYEIANKVFYVNTFMKMLNKLLQNKNMKTIKVGIGVSTAQELVVKAGREKTGINNLVWIGKAVTYASKFSSLANSNGYNNIIFSDNFYNSFIGDLKNNNKNKNVESWFKQHRDSKLGCFYDCDIIQSEFNDWIENGMKG